LFGFKRRRRKRLREQPFPLDWRAILGTNAPYYSILPPVDQRELEGHIAVFIAEKNFEGCGDLKITNEIRVTIAAHACILLLHRETDYYPRLDSILVYPRPFFAETATRGPGKTYIKGRESRVGESWCTGAVIFAWSDVTRSIRHRDEGHNVLFHEFAHQLDSENFVSDGFPIMDEEEIAEEWSEAFSNAYEQFLDDVEQGHETIIDEYGAESPPEFFAVLTETFFELPVELSEDYPELYEAMKHYFRQDPATLVLQAEQRAAKPES
jgi:Mlc titration factor MtfA (ptsG expression regulator)